MRKEPHVKIRARDLNRNLGAAMDVLHAHDVYFYNDPLEHRKRGKNAKRTTYGRGIKPMWPVSKALHVHLSELADAVSRRGQSVRYHFIFDVKETR
jgi:hypothetical protein